MYPHETEMLERLWFPVAREADVGPGPFATGLLGHRIVLYRTSRGIAAARDRCPHRWVRLSLGRAVGDELECPYHGWRFDHDGRCRLVPSQPGAHPAAKLETFPVHTSFGFVWISIREPFLEPPDIIEMADQLMAGRSVTAICSMSAGAAQHHGELPRLEYFAFVHKETFGNVSPLIPAYTCAGMAGGWPGNSCCGTRRVEVKDGAGAGSKYRFGGTDATAGCWRGLGGSIHYRFCAVATYVYTEQEGGGKRIV